jgi:hypothetical protein
MGTIGGAVNVSFTVINVTTSGNNAGSCSWACEHRDACLETLLHMRVVGSQ